ncbi:MAG: pyrroline-5-carboxylate reductase [Lacipirellulaceae bacterium]
MIDGVVGFLGAGQMAQALAGGWVREGLVTSERLSAFDPHPTACKKFIERVGAGAAIATSNADIVKASDIVFLAVKPQYAHAALAEAAAGVPADELRKKLFVSIAAGVSLAAVDRSLGGGAAVVRVMPNTPCLVGRGASCYARGAHASTEHGAIVHELLSAVGSAAEVPERLLDAVTGLSGSGPAFVYTVIEALADGGVEAGLPRALAADLAARTVAGAAEMVIATGQHPAVLRDAVASPAGTTVAGLAELERRGLRAALSGAVVAAAVRSVELGRLND